MQVRHMIVLVLVVAVVVGVTTGCSSKRKSSTACAQQPACPAPCPQPCPQPCPPAPVCQVPQPPCPPSSGWTTPPAPPPPPTSSFSHGSPDATMVSGPPQGAFPASEPAVAAEGELSEAIQSERDARMQLHQEVVALRERLHQAELEATAPPAPCPSPGEGAASFGGDGGRAAAFANAVRSKSCGEVERQGNLVVIRLSDAFQPGKETLKKNPSNMTTILTTAEELRSVPGAVVEVVGHSDTSPINKSRKRWRDNVHLSRERAQTVANALAKKGVPPSRMAVTGRGSAEPIVYPEKSSADRARNRRVEIRVRF